LKTWFLGQVGFAGAGWLSSNVMG